jgi:hypothetical protein
MRLWSIHPQYLDVKGFTGLWREALLAQRVLRGETRFYQHHPQIIRFRDQPDPLAAISAYLEALYMESLKRGYHFDHSRIYPAGPAALMPVTRGQLDYELLHLKRKLAKRAPRLLERLPVEDPSPHPLFFVVEGPIESWERIHSTDL